jgi:hypothetical protein
LNKVKKKLEFALKYHEKTPKYATCKLKLTLLTD